MAYRNSGTRRDAAVSAPAFSSSAPGWPSFRCCIATHCSWYWLRREPGWEISSSICAVTARRLPVCSDSRPSARALLVPRSPLRRHLLVVDDEPHIGLLLRPHLEGLGYRVSLARTLSTARAALAPA